MLVCPDCNNASLEIIEKFEMGPNDYADENAYQLLQCSLCSTNAVGVYDESRRGAQDSFHHSGYRIDDKALRKLREIISSNSRTKIQQSFAPYIDRTKEFHIEIRAVPNRLDG